MGNNYNRRRNRNQKKRTKQSRRQVIPIDKLPDDALLEIFDFYVHIDRMTGRKSMVEAWQSLVHVCRRWRTLVLESPRRLNLRLYCGPETPAKDTLDVWPALPIIVMGGMSSAAGTDDVVAALGQSNRVCEVCLPNLVGWQLEEVLAAMQVPFPELTELSLAWNDETMPVVPDSFLDGSAPRLRYLHLDGIPFPGLPKLLLSATHLVNLGLYSIPHSGYISPEAMVALLSALSRLEWLSLQFQSPQSRPDRETRRPPPSRRSVIPALGFLGFKGVIEYLDDLVTRIDTPQLHRLRITLFNQIDFDTRRLAQFVSRNLKRTITQTYPTILFNDDSVAIDLSLGNIRIAISCREPGWQLSSIEQVCNSFWRTLPTIEDLHIQHKYSELVWKNDAVENTLWLQLLLPFTAVKDLRLSKEFAPGIAAALQELGGDRITEVLPSLRNIYVNGLELSGPFQENIGQFVAARQLSNHTITVSEWGSQWR